MTGVVACWSIAAAVAQHPWQKMQMPTASEVAKVWTAPPPEYGPEPYYGLNGPVTIETVTHDLDTMKTLGFHAVTVQAGYSMKQAYLSPEYIAFFKQLVAEAKKRDMRVWIVDEAGYPSGFAGGKFSSEKPELRMQALAITQRLLVKAGERLNQAVSANTVAAVATTAAGERVPIPIPTPGGNIAWTAPAAGDWTVLVVEHVFRTSPTRSDTNPTRLKDATQSLEDYINPAATAAYLEFTHEQYYKAMGDEFGKTILGFRGDEPDYSIAGLPWTPAFFARFEQVKGYDIRPYVAAMLMSQGGRGQTPAKLTTAEQRAKADYYDVFSQMFRDGFFKVQGDWCAAHGVEYEVHLNHEEMEMDLVRSEGDFLRDMKYVEVPGVDTIWHQIWTDTISDFPRLAASAAHLYAHPRVFTESFAAYRPAPDVIMARYILNEQMVRGVNTIETMYYPSTATAQAAPATVAPATVPPATLPPTVAAPATAPPASGFRHGGPSAVMLDPGWPALMDYVRRLSYVMSMGRPAAAVALYLPSDSMWMGDADADTAFVATEQMLSERQIDFDIVGVDSLETDLKPGPGTFQTLSGNLYKTVIIPSASVIPEATLQRLRAFAQADGKVPGGKVLFLGRTPSRISGKTILDARAATPSDFAWATVETSAQLPPTPTPPAQPPASAPVAQVVPEAIEKALNTVIGSRDVTLDSPDTSLKVITRRLKDASVYLFLNEGSRASAHIATIRADANAAGGQRVEVWDPATGSVSAMASTPANGGITLKLNLKPYETRLLMIR